MNAFQTAIHAAFKVAETLPNAGTMLRPAANRNLLLGARDGVFTAAVVAAIVEARATSHTADDFYAATCGSIDMDMVDDLYSGQSSAESVENFAKRVIAAYISAESFAKCALS